MLKHVIPGETYRNIKTGDRYQVFQCGSHSETCENMIVYISSEPRAVKYQLGLFFLRLASIFLSNDQRVWIRPIGLFEEKFTEPK